MLSQPVWIAHLNYSAVSAPFCWKSITCVRARVMHVGTPRGVGRASEPGVGALFNFELTPLAAGVFAFFSQASFGVHRLHLITTSMVALVLVLANVSLTRAILPCEAPRHMVWIGVARAADPR